MNGGRCWSTSLLFPVAQRRLLRLLVGDVDDCSEQKQQRQPSIAAAQDQQNKDENRRRTRRISGVKRVGFCIENVDRGFSPGENRALTAPEHQAVFSSLQLVQIVLRRQQINHTTYTSWHRKKNTTTTVVATGLALLCRLLSTSTNCLVQD